MSRLFLRDLRLSHFRSHKAARLALDGRPVAIYGRNGAGKTNILEAISLLSPGRGMRRAAAADMTRRPEALGWKVSALVEQAERRYEIETWSDGGASRTVKVDGKAATQVQLGRIARVLWLLPSMDRLWIESAEGRRRFLDRMTLSFEPGHADVSLTYEKAMRERNRLLKEQIADAHWYRALEAQMAAAGAEIIANRARAVAALEAAQADAETSFPVATLSLLFAEAAEGGPESEADLLTAFAEGRARDLRAGRTLAGPHRADLGAVYAAKGVAAKDCSTGEQKALLVSLILANGRALAAEIGTPPVLLLDEVSAHLDAERRAALYDEICALGTQAFMTGTGPELFTDLGDRAQLLEVVEEGGVSALCV